MKLFKILVTVLFFMVLADAKMFQSVEKKDAILLQDGIQKMYCLNCGMNLIKFYKTSHAITLKDGKKIQYCSIHCLAEQLKDKNFNIEKIEVVGVDTNKFLEAKKAFYVVGSKVKGTMSMNSKYAFFSKEEAVKFVKKHGGEIKSFNEALEIANKDFINDMGMLFKKRSTKMWGMGKKIYNSRCDKKTLDSIHAHNMGEMKAKINSSKACGKLDDKKTQALLLYMWDVKMQKFEKKYGKFKSSSSVKLPNKSKCPVCGMIVNKYPKWVSKISTVDGEFYFDGVKDMMKFYYEPLKYVKKDFKINSIEVSDYYSLKALKAKDAFYVIGSNVFGPMGHELIPFESKKDAQVFLKDHSGKKIISFKDITKKIIDEL